MDEIQRKLYRNCGSNVKNKSKNPKLFIIPSHTSVPRTIRMRRGGVRYTARKICGYPNGKLERGGVLRYTVDVYTFHVWAQTVTGTGGGLLDQGITQ